MPLGPSDSKDHVASASQLLFSNLIPASGMHQHDVDVVQIRTMRCRLPLRKINIGELRLEVLQGHLNADIGHPMMVKLRRHVLFDDLALGIADRIADHTCRPESSP